MMIVVIIAGGSGTRLWPLSTPEYPKHLLKVEGGDDSLLQSTYARAKSLSDNVYIISEKGHIHHVKEQLSELDDDAFIIEPERRGTAGCIVASLSKISKKHDNDEPIAFMHADHFIRSTDAFRSTLKKAAEVATFHNQIVLLGIKPDYPAINFGYIQKGDQVDAQEVYKVHSFKEKPEQPLAQEYFESGSYLWNAGYFVASINTFVREMGAVAPELMQNYEALQKASDEEYDEVYLGFKNIAIDYALIEKVPDLLMIPAEFDWMDVGSFNDLHTALKSDDSGNNSVGNVELESVNNSIVQNYEDKPVAVIGLENIAVINTPKGLIVTHKDSSQKVGDVSKRFTLQ